MNERNLSLVGESFDNPDGSSRQKELKKCREGDQVFLTLDPENPYDEKAVIALSERGIGIGMVGRDERWVYNLLSAGHHLTGWIDHIGRSNGGKLGVRLCVADEGAREGPPPAPTRTTFSDQLATVVGCGFMLAVVVVLLLLIF